MSPTFACGKTGIVARDAFSGYESALWTLFGCHDRMNFGTGRDRESTATNQRPSP
jgi:hypothetical protein